ncbi:hypothetical protein [Ammoniphilus sp. CFH 90114]|uniref:hypothetical protein n=1 Tax=Ammoniphilus sp. CFH 90114 TaxID=2493665 RepID=UPI00100F522C|nr:hypothetical protein [Ammoniphilus sp. CFH 90114]RXT14867.1 hypothetical protein EIZ39_01250 [Ammoniphilus sp. CFH 90114]
MSSLLKVFYANQSQVWISLSKVELFDVLEEILTSLSNYYFTEAKIEVAMELFIYPKIVDIQLNKEKRHLLIKNTNFMVNYYLNDNDLDIKIIFNESTKKIGFSIIKDDSNNTEYYRPFYEVTLWFYPIDSFLDEIEAYFQINT